jgi:AraC-like DNA-binding protein
VGVDRQARGLLNADDTHASSRLSLWELFDKDAELFRNRNPDEKSAALVRLGTGEIWSALVTPPASAVCQLNNSKQSPHHSRPRIDSIGYFQPPTSPTRFLGGLAPLVLRRVCDLDARLGEALEMDALAGVAGLSRWYFSRAFKQSEGVTPHAYTMYRRVERARKLLTETDMPLVEIALECGLAIRVISRDIFASTQALPQACSGEPVGSAPARAFALALALDLKPTIVLEEGLQP